MWNEYKVCESWYSDSLKPQRDECISDFCCIPSSTIFSPTCISTYFRFTQELAKSLLCTQKGIREAVPLVFPEILINTYQH